MLVFGLLVLCLLIGLVCAFREGSRGLGIGLLLLVLVGCGWVMLFHVRLG